jgi:cbb3-type cytochrome oxidase maturation protein
MTALSVLVPLSILMGVVGLLAFLWSMHAKQYEDLDGAAERILLENDAVDENLAGETRDPTG